MTPVDKTVTTCQGVKIFIIFFFHQIPNKKILKVTKFQGKRIQIDWAMIKKLRAWWIPPPPDTKRVNCQGSDISSWKFDLFMVLDPKECTRSAATNGPLCNTLSSNKYLVKILAIKWLRYNQDFYKIWNSVILSLRIWFPKCQIYNNSLFVYILKGSRVLYSSLLSTTLQRCL